MSWLHNLTGNNPPARYRSDGSGPKTQDPSNPKRMVDTKQANQPFLAHKQYRNEQEALHNAWLERKKERDAKVARGEKVGPEERDPTAEREVGFLGLLKFIFYLGIIISLSGKFLVGSYTWGWQYEGALEQVKSYWPATGVTSNERLFTEKQLAEFDGTKPNTPIYIALDGDVYDVSKSAHTYGPGGSYHLMSGVDAARSFGTGCFKTHRTHDLRGLTDAEYKGVMHWKKFFAEHKNYGKIGRVLHPPIDPASPIPEHCNPPAEEEKKQEKKSGHEEL